MSHINVQKLEPYKPPFSVWKLIEATVPARELPLVKSFIGESSIEYCIDLRIELEILLDIWKEVGDRIEPPIVTKSVVNSILPDPPKLKELLMKEIQMLVKELQEKSDKPSSSTYEEKDKKVIQYAMLLKPNELERPSTPLRQSQSDGPISSPFKLKQIQRNLNLSGIEPLVDMLKDAIKNECEQLQEDIEFLQRCVEEEHEVLSSRPTTPIEEPSVNQLRQVCRTLERQALSHAPSSSSATAKIGVGSSAPINSEPSAHPSSPGKQPTPPSPQRVQLKPLETKPQLKPLMYPSRSRLPGSTGATDLQPADVDDVLNDTDILESWIEPSWSKCMSDSRPPSTGDSGVASRPGTCELSAMRERRRISSAQNEENWKRSRGSDRALVSDLGYSTSSSSELNSSAPSFSLSRPKRRTYAVSLTPAPPLSPHPPKKDGIQLSSKNVSARKFTRKLIKTS